MDLIAVPDFTAAGLLDYVTISFRAANIPLRQADPELREWDFLDGENGNIFEVIRQPIAWDWTIQDALEWQESVGGDGNIAAFLAWVASAKPEGRFTTFPRDVKRCFTYMGELPCGLAYLRTELGYELRLAGMGTSFPSSGEIVAFKKAI